MQAQKKGTNKLIEARLRAYDEAMKAGKSSKDAFTEARKITRRKLGKLGR